MVGNKGDGRERKWRRKKRPIRVKCSLVHANTDEREKRIDAAKTRNK